MLFCFCLVGLFTITILSLFAVVYFRTLCNITSISEISNDIGDNRKSKSKISDLKNPKIIIFKTTQWHFVKKWPQTWIRYFQFSKSNARFEFSDLKNPKLLNFTTIRWHFDKKLLPYLNYKIWCQIRFQRPQKPLRNIYEYQENDYENMLFLALIYLTTSATFSHFLVSLGRVNI